ncbi:MAG: hypothetical protein AAB420_02175 [Patescibacteria group bacterium]
MAAKPNAIFGLIERAGTPLELKNINLYFLQGDWSLGDSALIFEAIERRARELHVEVTEFVPPPEVRSRGDDSRPNDQRE